MEPVSARSRPAQPWLDTRRTSRQVPYASDILLSVQCALCNPSCTYANQTHALQLAAVAAPANASQTTPC
jgi:hypothetical protein